MSENNIDLCEIPVSCLKDDSRKILSMLLNPCKVIPTDDDLPRDWRGLAHLADISAEMIPYFTSLSDPTAGVLSHWSEKWPQNANLQRLQEFLKSIDRFDVVDDTQRQFVSDAVDFLNTPRSGNLSNGCTSELPTASDHDILTVHDMQLSQQGQSIPQLYDAFVLFADEDIDFVYELITRMENYGFKLCIKDRDMLGGLSSQHGAVLRLISERCHRLIVIVSPAFLESPANAFFVDFAQALGIEQRQRKIVPCLYKNCQLPPQLSYYFFLNYQRSGKLWNFWDKLRDSLRTTPIPLTYSQRATIRELESSVKTLSVLPNRYVAPRLAIASAPSCISSEIDQKPPSITISPPDTTMSIQSNGLPAEPNTYHHQPLGQASSMVNLSSPSDSLTRMINFDNSSDMLSNDTGLCISALDIPDIVSNGDSVKKDTIKKKKWFKKILNFNSHSNVLNDYNQSEAPIKKKKKWNLKKSLPLLAD